LRKATSCRSYGNGRASGNRTFARHNPLADRRFAIQFARTDTCPVVRIAGSLTPMRDSLGGDATENFPQRVSDAPAAAAD
jgi:hypothetical protein